MNGGDIVLTPELARLAAAIDDMRKVRDVSASSEAALEELCELRRQIDQLESVFTQRVAAAHRSGAASAQGYATTKAFLRHACRLNSGVARQQIDVGIELVDRPDVAEDFAHGTISFAHVTAIIDALAPLPDAVQHDAEPVLLEVARRHAPSHVRQTARRLRHIVDPDGQAGIDERRYEERWVELPISYGGMGIMRGVLDPESAAVVRAALDALSTPAGKTDDRTPAQRRADALVEMARNSLDSGSLPESGGERPHLLVVVDHASLTGASAAPAQLAFDEPLGLAPARRIACDALVTRVVRDDVRQDRGSPPGSPPGCLSGCPPGYLDALPPQLRGPTQVLDVGRASRTATAAIRKALAVRDGGCVMPGCDRGPSRCEAHHVIHWVDGGVTALHNMVLLCAFHHHFVHERGWRVQVRGDGTVSVTPPQEQAA